MATYGAPMRRAKKSSVAVWCDVAQLPKNDVSEKGKEVLQNDVRCANERRDEFLRYCMAHLHATRRDGVA